MISKADLDARFIANGFPQGVREAWDNQMFLAALDIGLLYALGYNVMQDDLNEEIRCTYPLLTKCDVKLIQESAADIVKRVEGEQVD